MFTEIKSKYNESFFNKIEEDHKENIKINHENLLISGIENSKLEILTNYFDVVPDARIMLKNSFPLFTVRFRTAGLSLLIKEMERKHKIKYDCHGFLFEDDTFSIDSSHAKSLFSINNKSLSEINFSDIKNGEKKGILINFSNSNSRLMHTSPLIFGANEKGKKYIIIMDPYFYFFSDPDSDCLSMTAMKYFHNLYPDAEIYAHDNIMIKDQNSCAIIALEYMNNILSKDCIINQILASEEIISLNEQEKIYKFRKFNIPTDLLHLNQSVREIESISTEKKPVIKKCLYRKIRSYYNPGYFFKFHDETCAEKDINLCLHLNGHLYAKKIIQILEKTNNQLNIPYDPDYWMRTILKDSENKDKDFIKFLIRLRRNLKPRSDIKKTQSILSEEKFLIV